MTMASANHETLLVEERAVFASDFDSPIPRVRGGHGSPCVGAVSAFGTGFDGKVYRLAETILAIPTVFNRGVVRRFHARIKKQHPGFQRAMDLVATPIGGRETATQVCFGDGDGDGCRCPRYRSTNWRTRIRAGCGGLVKGRTVALPSFRRVACDDRNLRSALRSNRDARGWLFLRLSGGLRWAG